MGFLKIKTSDSHAAASAVLIIQPPLHAVEVGLSGHCFVSEGDSNGHVHGLLHNLRVKKGQFAALGTDVS